MDYTKLGLAAAAGGLLAYAGTGGRGPALGRSARGQNEAHYKAKGWDAYRKGWDASEWRAFTEGSWQRLAWKEGYLAAEKARIQQLHRRSWDPQGYYGPVPTATLPPGAEVYPQARQGSSARGRGARNYFSAGDRVRSVEGPHKGREGAITTSTWENACYVLWDGDKEDSIVFYGTLEKVRGGRRTGPRTPRFTRLANGSYVTEVDDTEIIIKKEKWSPYKGRTVDTFAVYTKGWRRLARLPSLERAKKVALEIAQDPDRERPYGRSARGRRAYVHAGSPELPRTLGPHDAHVILKHYPLMEGNHPEIRYQVNSGLSAPSSSKRGLMGSPRRLFLNFDRDGELLGYNYIDSRTKLPFNTAADNSVIGLTGGKSRFGSTKWEETKGKRGKARPKLFIASLLHGDYHPDYNKELAAEFGGKSRAIKGSIRDSDYYKYNWRAAWAALHAGAIPTMKDMNKARGTANKRGQR